jgi:prophage regulatory protein
VTKKTTIEIGDEPVLYTAEGTRIVRLPEILALTGATKASIYNWLRSGRFPRQLKMGPKAVGWRWTDVKAWLDANGLSADSDASKNE